jgi:hypothetical protein
MRLIATVVAVIGLFFLGGYLYLRRMGLDSHGMTIGQSIAMARAQRALVRIAYAEQEQMTVYSECDSVDDLISRGKIDANDEESNGYRFSVECDGANFSVIGRHAPSPPDSPLRWPELIADGTRSVRANWATVP